MYAKGLYNLKKNNNFWRSNIQKELRISGNKFELDLIVYVVVRLEMIDLFIFAMLFCSSDLLVFKKKIILAIDSLNLMIALTDHVLLMVLFGC